MRKLDAKNRRGSKTDKEDVIGRPVECSGPIPYHGLIPCGLPHFVYNFSYENAAH